jgi:hypothetical protein
MTPETIAALVGLMPTSVTGLLWLVVIGLGWFVWRQSRVQSKATGAVMLEVRRGLESCERREHDAVRRIRSLEEARVNDAVAGRDHAYEVLAGIRTMMERLSGQSSDIHRAVVDTEHRPHTSHAVAMPPHPVPTPVPGTDRVPLTPRQTPRF